MIPMSMERLNTQESINQDGEASPSLRNCGRTHNSPFLYRIVKS